MSTGSPTQDKYEKDYPGYFSPGIMERKPGVCHVTGHVSGISGDQLGGKRHQYGAGHHVCIDGFSQSYLSGTKPDPEAVRIVTYIVIIASFVTIVDYLIQAISLELYNALGAFIQLIVANCVILGRAESYASRQKLSATVVNSAGMGLGFTLALFSLGSVREILGAGTLFGLQIMPTGFEPWVVMLLPPGGFFVLGCWLLLFAYARKRKEQSDLNKLEVAHGK